MGEGGGRVWLRPISGDMAQGSDSTLNTTSTLDSGDGRVVPIDILTLTLATVFLGSGGLVRRLVVFLLPQRPCLNCSRHPGLPPKAFHESSRYSLSSRPSQNL